MAGVRKPVIGIIGGTGVDDPEILEDFQSIKVHTPYGAPSDKVVKGTYQGVPVAIIARHGEGHRISPTNVNYRANIWALKEQGVTHIIAPTACGSLRENIKPGHLVFIDQFIDRTTKRASTFYDGQVVCHIPMADPFCPNLRKELMAVAVAKKYVHHTKGTMVTIEGPRFSTRAESHMFRAWGADVINMTTVPECILAREAGMCYAPIAMSTDYDCWHAGEDDVSIEIILKTIAENGEKVKLILLAIIPKISGVPCACQTAHQSALI